MIDGGESIQDRRFPSDMDFSRIYIGTLDDSVSRYPWVGHNPDQRYLNRLLLESALFGRKGCARIGNILYHRPYFEALLRPERSPMRSLLRSGFFQIQMREETINETIASRKAEQTNSTLQFIRETGWDQPGSEIRDVLDQVDRTLAPYRGKRRYSPRFRPFFDLLIEEAEEDIAASARDLVVPIIEEWREKNRIFGAPLTRSAFEETAKDLMRRGRLPEIQTAMRWINATNHFAYGVGMRNEEPDREIFVDTTRLSRVSALCSLDQNVDVASVLELMGLSQEIIAQVQQVMTIPEALNENWELWDRLSDLLDQESEDSRAQVFQARKQVFARHVDIVLASPGAGSVSGLVEAGREYSAALYDGLGLRISRDAPARFEATFVLSGMQAEGRPAAGLEADAALSGRTVSLAFNVHDRARARSGVERARNGFKIQSGPVAAMAAPGAFARRLFGALPTPSMISIDKMSRLERRLARNR